MLRNWRRKKRSMNRRELLRQFVGAGGVFLGSPLVNSCKAFSPSSFEEAKTTVAFVKTNDRAKGVSQAIDLLKLDQFRKRDLFIKPNFNNADEAPGSTHNDILKAVVGKVRDLGAGKLTVGDRSGMGNTYDVFENKGIFALARELKFKTLVFDNLRKEDWEHIKFRGSHWKHGFYIPKQVRNAGGVIQTCCLKTHRFGGHFTLSLKNSVGLAAKFVPGNSYNFMSELHSSPNQRQMIAEVNAAYNPNLIVLDGVEAFTTGGPESGKMVNAQVILAGTDRVAIDAVGVAILRNFGTTPQVSKGSIFKQEQIARAAELNIGITKPSQIRIVTNDSKSTAYARQIQELLPYKV